MLKQDDFEDKSPIIPEGTTKVYFISQLHPAQIGYCAYFTFVDQNDNVISSTFIEMCQWKTESFPSFTKHVKDWSQVVAAYSEGLCIAIKYSQND